LVHFSGFGILYQEKSGNPASFPDAWLRKKMAGVTFPGKGWTRRGTRFGQKFPRQ
jgi:hypothetical protein